MQDKSRSIVKSPDQASQSRSLSIYIRMAISLSLCAIGFQLVSLNFDLSQVNLDRLRELINTTLQRSQIVLIIVKPKATQSVLRSRRKN